MVKFHAKSAKIFKMEVFNQVVFCPTANNWIEYELGQFSACFITFCVAAILGTPQCRQVATSLKSLRPLREINCSVLNRTARFRDGKFHAKSAKILKMEVFNQAVFCPTANNWIECELGQFSAGFRRSASAFLRSFRVLPQAP
jgi:hypothetical protein